MASTTVMPHLKQQEAPWKENKTDGIQEPWKCEWNIYLRTEQREAVLSLTGSELLQ